MTEAEWLACEDVEAVAEMVWQTVSDRKAQLIACGCCRLAWDWLIDERSQKAVEVSERFADSLATDDELGRAAWFAEAVVFALHAKQERYQREQKAIRDGWLAAADSVEDGFLVRRNGPPILFNAAISAANCAEATTYNPSFREYPNPLFSLAILRDIFGNPFRPVAFSPSWRTDTALSLARGIYDERAFDRMPILADALQDAGCDDLDVLNHCRDVKQTHVRGCWVVDLLLEKR